MATPFPYVAGAILTADQLNNIHLLKILLQPQIVNT